jgi:hypothetical protein
MNETTADMLNVIYIKLGYEEGKRRIEAVRKADKVRVAVAIATVYRSIK